MSKALQVPVLVEGIETVEQLEFARQNQCDEVQGYYHGRPLPERQARELLMSLSAGIPVRLKKAPLPGLLLPPLNVASGS
jgi:predicted signal transduction protein with EAL and GGDEF domain